MVKGLETFRNFFIARYATADIDTSALGVAIDANEIRQRLALCFGF